MVKFSRLLQISSNFWTSSGSCPLCLTPPCYHLEPPATAALFSCGVASARGARSRIALPPATMSAASLWTQSPDRAMLAPGEAYKNVRQAYHGRWRSFLQRTAGEFAVLLHAF